MWSIFEKGVKSHPPENIDHAELHYQYDKLQTDYRLYISQVAEWMLSNQIQIGIKQIDAGLAGIHYDTNMDQTKIVVFYSLNNPRNSIR